MHRSSAHKKVNRDGQNFDHIFLLLQRVNISLKKCEKYTVEKLVAWTISCKNPSFNIILIRFLSLYSTSVVDQMDSALARKRGSMTLL